MRFVPVSFVRHLFFGGLMYAVACPSFAGPSLKFKTNLQEIFGDDKGAVLATAGQLSAIQLAKDSVWDCARQSAWRGMPKESGIKWVREAWFDAKQDVKIPAYVTSINDADVAGRGILRTLLGFGNAQISIKINPDIVPAKDTDDAMNFLLEVVVHEIGHNIGLSHGPESDYDENYRGYYVEALGLCAKGDGKFPGWPANGLLLNGRMLQK